MKKVKILTYTVVLLLLLNIGLIGFIVFRQPPHPHWEGPKQEIIDKLKLKGDQVTSYEKLITWHRQEIGAAEDQILNLKRELYQTLSGDQPHAMKDSLIHEIALVQINIEQTHYQHFLDLKALCNSDQLNDFKSLTMELADLFAPKGINDKK